MHKSYPKTNFEHVTSQVEAGVGGCFKSCSRGIGMNSDKSLIFAWSSGLNIFGPNSAKHIIPSQLEATQTGGVDQNSDPKSLV